VQKGKKYRLNKDTLAYEVVRTSRSGSVIKVLIFFALSVVLTFFYLWLYLFVLELPLPKTYFLSRKNTSWNTKIELMNKRLDAYDEALASLQQRDDDVYRSVFGMKEIPAGVRNAGFAGDTRYEELEGVNDKLMASVKRVDYLTKKAYIQSKSFDEVYALAVVAGDMATCVPSIPPIYPDDKYHLSSTFGYRIDPKWGGVARHTGIDLATDTGNPVYSTGDGIIRKVAHENHGYGNFIIVDHGFGYKTRYAHLHTILVKEGQVVKRGEHIAYSGNSGKSTGAHLHYEVMYRDNYVNPLNYMDLSIPLEDYRNMVEIVPHEKGTTSRSRR